MARYFENSLAELEARNPEYEGAYRRIDANRFFATIYHNGKDVARATIYIGGDSFGRGINFVHGETTQSNTLNESLRVETDDQTPYLAAMGMASMGQEKDKKLSQEGAAELYWSLLIRPLQHG